MYVGIDTHIQIRYLHMYIHTQTRLCMYVCIRDSSQVIISTNLNLNYVLTTHPYWKICTYMSDNDVQAHRINFKMCTVHTLKILIFFTFKLDKSFWSEPLQIILPYLKTQNPYLYPHAHKTLQIVMQKDIQAWSLELFIVNTRTSVNGHWYNTNTEWTINLCMNC